MNMSIKTVLNRVLIISLPFILVGLYLSDNIRGYYEFDHLCSAEGGGRIYGEVESNSGWEVEPNNYAGWLASISGVKFVRVKDDSSDADLYDLVYVGGNRWNDNSFEREEVRTSFETKYKFVHSRKDINETPRLSRMSYEFIDLKSGDILADFHYFHYSFFDQSKTLLSAPSGNKCDLGRDTLENLIETMFVENGDVRDANK